MMSDTFELQARHYDPAALQPWGMRQADPAEELMAREEAAETGDEGSLSGVLRLVLVYCFSDAEDKGWDLPLWRAVSIMRNFCRGAIAGKGLNVTPREMWRPRTFVMTQLHELLRDEPAAREFLGRLMCYLVPIGGRNWEREAAKRLFLMAKAWLPVAMGDVELSRDGVRWVAIERSYEDLAAIFGELRPGAGKKERGRARARWCALTKRLIVAPVEAAGGSIDLHFSKSASTREKYRRAQMGNRNRGGNGPALPPATNVTTERR